MANLHARHFIHVSVLEFTSQVIELLIDFPAKSDFDQRIRDHKLGEILPKLSLKSMSLDSMLFSLTTAKVLHDALTYIKKDSILQKVIVQQFMGFLDFALKSSKGEELFEILCNMIYYFLTTSNLEGNSKLSIINYFFVLDGHQKTLQKILDGKTSPEIQFKSKVVMAEVMSVFMKFLSRSMGHDESWKKKSYEIVFKGTQTGKVVEKEASTEEFLMYIFEKFVDFMWKKKSFDKIEVLSNTAMILAVTKGTKSIDSTFFHMLMTLHTSTFTYINVRHNELLRTSAASALNSIKSISVVDLKFLHWWKTMGKPSEKLFNQVAMHLLTISKLPIEQHDAKLFDKKIILEHFLESSKTSTTFHGNLKEILCCYSDIGESSSEFTKLLSEWKRLRGEKGSQKAMNVMDVIIRNVGSVEKMELKRKTASNIMMIVKEATVTQHEKLAAIEMAANLLRGE
jgi:hypothetical protein